MKIAGKDPNGNTKGVAVTENGEVKVQQTGSNVSEEIWLNEVVPAGGYLETYKTVLGNEIGFGVRFKLGTSIDFRLYIEETASSFSFVSDGTDIITKTADYRGSIRWTPTTSGYRLRLYNLSEVDGTLEGVVITNFM